jgi:hypothetical protein
MKWLRLTAWTAAGVAVAAVSYAAGTLWLLLVAIVAVLLNGFVAVFEDDLPGGFNNPDGTQTPRYALFTLWSFRVVGVLFILGSVVVIALELLSRAHAS